VRENGVRANSLWRAVLGAEKTVIEECASTKTRGAWSFMCGRWRGSGVGAGGAGGVAVGMTRAVVSGAGGGRWIWG